MMYYTNDPAQSLTTARQELDGLSVDALSYILFLLSSVHGTWAG